MPNGGPDNCGTCGFNRRNRGIWRNSQPDESQTSFCELRGISPTGDHWTYCQNWHTRSRTITGPVYASGLYEGGYRRIPWHGNVEPEFVNAGVCSECGKTFDEGIRWKARRRSFAATYTICNGGGGSIPAKKRR